MPAFSPRYDGMAVKAYIIHGKRNGSKLPGHFRSMTGPYLFASEAQAFAGVIATGASSACEISAIFIERLLAEAIQSQMGWVVTSVWDITPSGHGFKGEAIINGKRRAVERPSASHPWRVVEAKTATLAGPAYGKDESRIQ
jgi:hypothetical protein